MTHLKEIDQESLKTQAQNIPYSHEECFKQFYDETLPLELQLELKNDLAQDSYAYTLCDSDPTLKDEPFLSEDEELFKTSSAPQAAPMPITPFELAACRVTKTMEAEPIESIAPSQAIIDLITNLSESIGLLSHTLQMNGISQTSCLIDRPGSLLDQVELVLSAFDTAPFEYHLEISSCDKLQALLHSHQRSLITHLAHGVQPIKLSRFEVNGQSMNLKKDKIEGSLFKKVAQVK